ILHCRKRKRLDCRKRKRLVRLGRPLDAARVRGIAIHTPHAFVIYRASRSAALCAATDKLAAENEGSTGDHEVFPGLISIKSGLPRISISRKALLFTVMIRHPKKHDLHPIRHVSKGVRSGEAN